MVVKQEWPAGVDVNTVTDAVVIISARVAQRYRTLKTVDANDISQELWVFAWRRREKIREYLDREDRREMRKGWSALLTTFERHAERYCQKAKAKEIGYNIEDLYWYTTDALQDWINILVNGKGVLTNQSADNAKVIRVLSESFSLEATLADVKNALGVLDKPDQALLLERYGDAQTVQNLSKRFELSESTIDRRCEASLKKMVKFLGGPRPW